MPFAPHIQQWIDQNIINVTDAENLLPETVAALASETFQQRLSIESAPRKAVFDTIAAIDPKYVVNMLNNDHICTLLARNQLTKLHIQKITTADQYAWLFGQEWKPVHYGFGIVTPRFIELIADEDFRHFCSHPEVNHTLMIVKRVRIGEHAYNSVKILIEDIGLSRDELYRLADHPKKLVHYINKPGICRLIATIIKHGDMTKQDFLDADLQTIATLTNLWVIQLLTTQRMTFAELQSIKDEYTQNINPIDSLSFERISTNFIKDRLRDVAGASQVELTNLIRNFRLFKELINEIPEWRNPVINKVLSSSALFDRVITNQEEYAYYRANYNDNLPLRLASILVETTYKQARIAQRSMYQEHEIRLAARFLVKGWKDQSSVFAQLPLDMLTLIAAHTANTEGHLSPEQCLHLAHESVNFLSRQSACVFGNVTPTIPANLATQTAPSITQG